jgi:hypothetical protein
MPTGEATWLRAAQCSTGWQNAGCQRDRTPFFEYLSEGSDSTFHYLTPNYNVGSILISNELLLWLRIQL